MVKQTARSVLYFLRDAQLNTAADALANELAELDESQQRFIKRFVRMREAVVSGDWAEVHRLFAKLPRLSRSQQLLFKLYQQQYLELVQNQEPQKALAFLNKYLKPLQDCTTNEVFLDICFLLTCKEVREAPSFRKWAGVSESREQLASSLDSLFKSFSQLDTSIFPTPLKSLPDLIQSAISSQIAQTSLKAPNCVVASLKCNRLPLKCLAVHQSLVFAGSRDRVIAVWEKETPDIPILLENLSSQVWDIATCPQSETLFAGLGDGTIVVYRIPDILTRSPEIPYSVLATHAADVYSLKVSPHHPNRLISSGYDKSIKLTDTETMTIIQTLSGHRSAVPSVAFGPSGHLVVSGSKDKSCRIWDIRSGICVRKWREPLGELCCVRIDALGSSVLTSSKDNMIRLFDMRSSKPLQSFKGHQNSFRSFIRTNFALNGQWICSGSEDGDVFIWNRDSGKEIGRLSAQSGIVFDAQWDPYSGSIWSCSSQGTVQQWSFDD